MAGDGFKALLVRRLAPVWIAAVGIGLVAQQPPPDAQKRYGLQLLDQRKYQSIPLGLTPFSGALPASIDFSGDMPPVGNQGTQDSCVLWSTVYAARTYLERGEGHWDVSSPSAQFSPSFIYNQIAKGDCKVSTTFPVALNLLHAQGAPTMSLMPYQRDSCFLQPTSAARQQALQYRIGGYRRINSKSINEVKSYLAAKFPVLVAMDTDASFLHLGWNEVWKVMGPSRGKHAVALVGYDDGQRAIKLINSWGSGWGTDGYGYISYDLFTSVAREAYIIDPFHDPAASPPQTAREANVRILSDRAVTAGPTPGFDVQLAYTLRGYTGHRGQIVLYFWYQDGRPVASTADGYKDPYGNAAMATKVFSIRQNEYTDYSFAELVPAAILDVPSGGYVSSGGQRQYRSQVTPLLMKAYLFVDDFGLAQSDVFSFSVAR